MPLDHNIPAGWGFIGDDDKILWPEDSHLPGSTSGGGIPTIMGSGLVNQNLLSGQIVGAHSTLEHTHLPTSPMTVAMGRDGNYVHTTRNFIGERSNPCAPGLSYTYIFPTALEGYTPQSEAAMYGYKGGCPHELSSLLWSPQLPLSLPTSSPSQLPLPSAIPSKPHMCDLCPGATTGFKLKKDLKRHTKTVHARGDEQVYCCRCEKQGVRKDNYLRHVRRCNKERHDIYYTCKCLFVCAEKEEHVDHVTNCQYGLGAPGRSNVS
ncbi:hypothetical protein F4680DRAFT_305183 [Xylaria scruposa]|nr:hypothetical protein F4680DRAFT_305183 [Xylaria scruposa]